MIRPKDLTWVVPCMGRLHHLKETLPLLLEQFPVVVVDWSDPDNCTNWVSQNLTGQGPFWLNTVRVFDQQYFNASRARNFGAKVVTTPWIGFIDADLKVTPEFKLAVTRLIEPGVMLTHESFIKRFAGVSVCSKQAFNKVGGYHEATAGYGGEDTQFLLKLMALGLINKAIPASCFKHIDHGDDERVKHYETKDMVTTASKNADILQANLLNFERSLEKEGKYDESSLSVHLLPADGSAGR